MIREEKLKTGNLILTNRKRTGANIKPSHIEWTKVSKCRPPFRNPTWYGDENKHRLLHLL